LLGSLGLLAYQEQSAKNVTERGERAGRGSGEGGNKNVKNRKQWKKEGPDRRRMQRKWKGRKDRKSNHLMD
jgi:hypothetical protein